MPMQTRTSLTTNSCGARFIDQAIALLALFCRGLCQILNIDSVQFAGHGRLSEWNRTVSVNTTYVHAAPSRLHAVPIASALDERAVIRVVKKDWCFKHWSSIAGSSLPFRSCVIFRNAARLRGQRSCAFLERQTLEMRRERAQ